MSLKFAQAHTRPVNGRREKEGQNQSSALRIKLINLSNAIILASLLFRMFRLPPRIRRLSFV